MKSRTYPISHDDDQKNSPLTNRALDEQRVSINQCQSDTPGNDQTHDCNQETAITKNQRCMEEIKTYVKAREHEDDDSDYQKAV